MSPILALAAFVVVAIVIAIIFIKQDNDQMRVELGIMEGIIAIILVFGSSIKKGIIALIVFAIIVAGYGLINRGRKSDEDFKSIDRLWMWMLGIYVFACLALIISSNVEI